MTTQTTPQKSSIKQQLRTDLGRSVGVSTATQLVWLTGCNTQKKFRISCNTTFKRLLTLKGWTYQAYILRGYFLHHYLQFLWKSINSEFVQTLILNRTLFLPKKEKTLLILCFNDVFTIRLSVWNCIRIDAFLPVLSSSIQLYPFQESCPRWDNIYYLVFFKCVTTLEATGLWYSSPLIGTLELILLPDGKT